MSGPRIGQRGRSKAKNGQKQANGRLVKLYSTDELLAVVEKGAGKDKLKAQNELVKRRYTPELSTEEAE